MVVAHAGVEGRALPDVRPSVPDMSDLIDDLTDLGFASGSATPDDENTSEPERRPAPLVQGSATAKALYSVWTGQRCTIVDSPPGGGKTRLTVTIAAHLVVRGRQHITIAAFTRAQVVALANRLTEQIDPELIHLRMKGDTGAPLVQGIRRKTEAAAPGVGSVTVCTLASLGTGRYASTPILMVDEAYQSTFASVATAANAAEQVIMVGDPGQIGPVVTVDTGAWERLKMAPHRPAPLVFGQREDAQRVSIDRTYRLGPLTADAIAPLYRFPFRSARPDKHVTLAHGQTLSEVESLAVQAPANPEDEGMLWTVARRAASLVGARLTVTDDDSGTVRELDERDVAVVVAQNSQVSILTAMLSSLGSGQVTVGTADSLQGGEWQAVVALDPLAGGVASEHHTAPGRLCVMASRHTAHLTWVHDGRWREALSGTALGPAARRSAKVRRALADTRAAECDPTRPSVPA